MVGTYTGLASPPHAYSKNDGLGAAERGVHSRSVTRKVHVLTCDCDCEPRSRPALSRGTDRKDSPVTIQFAELSTHYPSEQYPCADGWDNQCAIRMSIALEGAGLSLADYHAHTCSHGHARGAEALASYLRNRLGRPQVFANPSSAKASLRSRRGIIFFKDITDFHNGTGDHIDLWDGSSTRRGQYFSRCRQAWFFNLI